MADEYVVVMTGRLGRDAEQMQTKNGQTFLKFTMASSKNKEDTKWWSVVMYGGYSPGLIPYLAKGAQVSVVGTPGEPKQFQKKDGSTGTDYPFVAYKVSLLGGGRREGDRPPSMTPAPAPDEF